MTTDIERRNFLQTAGLLASSAAAAGLIDQAASAQSAPPTGNKPMTYQAKPLSLDPKSIKGISENVIRRAILTP